MLPLLFEALQSERTMIRANRTLLTMLTTAALLVACSSDDNSGVGSLEAEKKEVILKAGEGIVFATGEITKGADRKGSDLVAQPRPGDIDLVAGVIPDSKSTDKRQMHVFRIADQRLSKNEIFDKLEDVPNTVPDGTNKDDFMHKAAKGNALVVENNLSAGYTKVFVVLVPAGKQIQLHYIALAGK
jgi:hypothetical protein